MNPINQSKILLGLVLLSALLMTPLMSNAQETEPGRRVIATPFFVTILLNDGRLEHYEIVESQGRLIGVTPAGWRNDSLGRVLLHVSRRGDGARAELWHLVNDLYAVEFYRADGSLIGNSQFSAQGVAAGQGIIGNPQAELHPEPQASEIITTTTTHQSSILNIFQRTRGYFDGTYYTVAAGDNLFRIALRFNTTLGALQALNGIPDPNQIYVGQRIRVR